MKLSYEHSALTSFEWDEEKDKLNRQKHGVPFSLAQYAFADPNRIILQDITHSTDKEKRYFCVGKIGEGILTVRFTYRADRIRIFGAGYWRKGKQIYEQENHL
ncbi:MAG: BrnT family toxin [Ardenticatenaceae bacterium]|nr:BrnT family toxin [Ardenticatenaceae bacterium]